MQRTLRIMALCFGLLLLSVGAFAQGQFGTLTGSIFDSSGAVVPAADITITNMDTGVHWAVKASSAGYYSLPVPPGRYQVEARQEGFKGSVAKDIVVPVAQVVTIDLTLQVGSATQSVTVTSQAPLLTPSTAELSNAISPKEFATLPLPLEQSGRSVMAFIYSSVPGAVGNDWNGSLNGGQYFTSNILMDGLSIANYNASGTMQPQASPSPDAISEFKVETSSYSAEYGNTSGGIVNYSMKSGTNQFHGSVYEYFKNPVLNATGWDVDQLPAGSLQKMKSPTRQNNFGVGLGGPIRKNKTFFFFNYEGNRLQGGSAVKYTTVPTSEMLKGDFSQWLWNQAGTDALGRPVYSYEIYDPTSTRTVPAGAPDPVTGRVNNSGSSAVIRDAFGFDPVTGMPGSNPNVIPNSYLSVASAKLLGQFPTPINSQLGNNEVGYGGTVNFPLNKWSLKIDHNIGSKHKIAASYAMSDTTTLWGKSGVWWEPAPSYPLDPMKKSSTPYRMFRLSEDWAINDHTMNHFAAGIDRTSSLNGQPAGDVNGWSANDLGITGVNTQHPKIPEIDMSSFAPPSGHPAAGKAALLSPFGSWQSSTSFDTSDGYIPYSDTLNYVRGKHSLKFGAELTRYRAAERTPGPLKFGFSYLQTALPGVYQKQTGHPFASFLLGAANTGTLGVSTTTPGFRQGVYSFYAQDDWRATPKLTVSYGLRWEIPLPQTEAYDRMSALDPTGPNPGADNYPGALAFLGNCQGCTNTNAFQKTYYHEFAPRLGLAYQATQKMVWRAGYGISYAPPIANGWPGATAGFNSSVNFASTSLYPREFRNAADPAIFWSQLTDPAQMPSWYATNGRIGVPPFTGTLPNRAPDSMNYQNIQYSPTSMAMPYTQNWNAGIQYMLPADILFEANYVGAKGTRLISYPLGQLMDDAPTKYMGLSQYGDYLGDDIDADLADPAAAAVLARFGITSKPFPSFTGAVADSLRPYPQFSSITNTFANFGNSTYHALQVTARRRVSSGLNFIAAYTWSKTLSNTDSALYTYSGYYWQDHYNQKGEKSVASFDYPQNVKLTWIYDLPLGRGKKFLSGGGKLDRLMGGWRVTAIHNYRSGDPLQIIDSGLLSGVGNSNFVSGVRADVVPGVAPKVSFHGPVDSINGTQYLSPNAFAAPPSSPSGTYATRWGTAPRYLTSARGPGWQSEDFAAMKDTRISERYKLMFRADFFNLFNRTGMADPVTDVSDPSSFGRIYDVVQGPRNIMLSLRLEF